MRLNDDGKTVAAMDCLVPGIGEIIGGSQREERLDVLTARMRELGLRERTTGGTWTSGATAAAAMRASGLGFERMVMYLTGVNNHPGRAAPSPHRGQRGVLTFNCVILK